MSLRKYNNKKRRRSQAFPDEQNEEREAVGLEPIEEEEDPEGQQPQVMMNGKEIVQNGDADGEASVDRAAKDLAVWEAFREEHYEVLEQLPLSLRRAYTLLEELDEQVNSDNDKILQHILKYVAMRKTLAQSAMALTVLPMDVDESANNEVASAEEQTSPSEPSARESPSPTSPTKRPKVRSKSGVNGSTYSARAGRDALKSAHSPPPPPQETTRSVIASLARLSEGSMRAANEKLNVARFACDLIDRYIRDIDREIKEQETSLSLGLRPGTHPATIVLPEVVLPKTSRAARIQETPFSDEFESPSPEIAELEATPELAETAEGAPEGAVETPPSTAQLHMLHKRRPRKSHGWSKKKTDHKEREKRGEVEREKETEKERTEPAAVVNEEENVPPEPQRERSVTKLTVTLPPLASLQQPQVQAAPVGAEDEERYCYCNGISYGEMVGCDGCDGWFHLGCIDEKTIPKGKWYCRDCAPTKGYGRPRAKHTRKRR